MGKKIKSHGDFCRSTRDREFDPTTKLKNVMADNIDLEWKF